MKVIYKDRNFLDRFRCIDSVKERFFDSCWTSGGLTYFKQGFNCFTVETACIIEIIE